MEAIMNRRQFAQLAGAAAAAALQKEAHALPQQQTGTVITDAEVDRSMKAAMTPGRKRQIAMLLYPGMYPLDLVGPHTFLSGLMNVDVHLVWKNFDPIIGPQKFALTPTLKLSDCPKDLDVLFIPGGTPGTEHMMRDREVLDFVADRGSRARYVTSVCTGSLILGAAGLLKGYRATSHWATRDILPLLGAIPVDQRIVEDRNRITGGGVTSGIDFGLLVAARLSDDTYAKMLQLINEYDPQPPFHAGNVKQAGPVLTEHLQVMLVSTHKEATSAALEAQKRLGLV
jgi:cyclohexyl-isocyanide hydratase